MNQNEQNEAKTVGKVQDRKLKSYGDIDLSNLDHLEHRDIARVASKMKLNIQYVSRVKRRVMKNTDVMAELLRIGGERKKKLETASA